MYRLLRNILLLVLLGYFALSLALITLAETGYRKAKTLEVKYLWDSAEIYYRQAVSVMPFNASYFEGYSELLLKKALYHPDGTKYLDRAVDLMKKARELNPMYAGYPLRIGEMDLMYASLPGIAEDASAEHIRRALQYFKKAYSLDPNGFSVNYIIALRCASIYDKLDSKDKAWAFERIRYVLGERPAYGEYIYPAMWRSSRDFMLIEKVTHENIRGRAALYRFIKDYNLWAFRKKVKDDIDNYRYADDPVSYSKKISVRNEILEKVKNSIADKNSLTRSVPQAAWRGKIEGSDAEIPDGNMYWDGTIYAPIILPPGYVKIKINAMGESAFGAWPYMIVTLDGEEIGECYVNDRNKVYSFGVETAGGLKVLGVGFVNDAGDEAEGEDRNLFIGAVEVEGAAE